MLRKTESITGGLRPTRCVPLFTSVVIFLASGGVQRGDQLLNVEGTSLLGVGVEQAHEELSKAMNRNSVSGIRLTTSSNSVLELSKFRLTTLCIQSSSHRVYARALHRYRRGYWIKSRSEILFGFLFAVHNRDAVSFTNSSNN